MGQRSKERFPKHSAGNSRHSVEPFWASGVQAVREILRAQKRPIMKCLMEQRHEFKELQKRVQQLGIPCAMTSREELTERLDHPRHQGIALHVGHTSVPTLEDIVQANHASPTLLILDHIEDPQNLGAIFRAAAFMNVNGVIISDRRSASVNETVIRVSAGATEWVPWMVSSNIVATIKRLKKMEVWVAGSVVEEGDSLVKTDLDRPIALVMGSEGQGISAPIVKQCDLLLTLPAPGDFSVLNVASATSVMLYEIARQKSVF